MLKIPKAKTLLWTNHSRAKMNFYRLSEQRIKRILNAPKRVEKGIAPKTIAAMQPLSVIKNNGKELWKQEIWVMVEDTKTQKKIISAWRYPGMTKPNSESAFNFLRSEYDEFQSSN
ncbi:MAG: hypothetical protein QMD86_02155 [Patescibacteria group bacterium]|nr:hypothetical protein [Patescibacteria group bacterium]